MAGLPSDYSLIGTVLAISLAIILLSGLALYVAFRVRETLREEHGRGARAAKVALLIGLLFLSGGVFYFFASGFNSQSGSLGSVTSSTAFTSSTSSTTLVNSSASNPSPTNTASSTSNTATSSGGSTSPSTTSVTTTIVTTTVVSTTYSSTTSLTTSSTSLTTTSSTTSSSTTSLAQGSLSITPSFPSTETKGSNFYGTFTIINNGSVTASSVTIQVGNLFNQFAFQSCTISINGGTPQDCKSSVSGNVISVGNVSSGTIVFTLGLSAPSQPGQYSDTVTLYYYLGTQHSFVTTIAVHITA